MDKIPTIKFRSALAKDGFEIKPLSELLATELPKDHNPFLPHRIEFFAVLIITAESGFHIVDFTEYRLKKNECLLISKGQVHAFKPNTKYEGYIILFTEDFLLKNFFKNISVQVLKLYNYHIYTPQHEVSAESFIIINIIQKEQNNNNILNKYKIIACLLGAWFGKLEQYNHEKQPSLGDGENDYVYFDKFKNYVENNYKSSRDAKHYAYLLSISYKHLNSISKKYTNKTAKAFIDDFVILEAKRFLCSTSLSIKEIAFKCGFDEQTNFQKYFKKITNETPLNFRQNLRG